MRINKEKFSITNNTSDTPPTDGVPFLDIKKEILGENYVLSLVFINNEHSQKLNREYRKKDKPTNVLSFPLSSNEGEIFINMNSVENEHKDFDRSQGEFIGYLFIHALYHLKGYDHSSKMEDEEEEIRKKFNI